MTSSLAFSRRGFLTIAGGAALTAGPAWGAELFPVVETAQGKLRGVQSGGIAMFKGVSYAASTAGANRFRPPQPLTPWTGVKDAFRFGQVSPQMPGNRASGYGDLIVFDRQPSGPGEDCLSINIWSPTLDANAKKPVIFVIHGGGFYGGSGNSFGMDGERMARFADSVVISVNHRLGAFGFTHLGDGAGEDFAQSGAAGMMDIVAALKWINENIVQFGGDPSRVLVYGQSGGGAKTSILLGMPSAKGLITRAGVMSGSLLKVSTPEAASKATHALLKALDIAPGDVRKLQEIPFHVLLKAQAGMEAAQRAKGEAPRSFAPVMDGVAIPDHPFDPGAPDVSSHVPMVISTALDERTYRMGDFDLDEAGLLAFIAKRAGNRAKEALDLYRAEDPDATPFILKARVDTDLGFRRNAFTQAERKAAAGGAPVWTYLWTWPSPAYGGRYGAVHGIDVGLSLNSVRGGLTGSGKDALLMAERISSVWASFAATGNPNNEALPDWDAYKAPERKTMVLDVDARQEADPRGHIRQFWDSVLDA